MNDSIATEKTIDPSASKKISETTFYSDKKYTVTLYANDLPDDFSLDGELAIDTETTGLSLQNDYLCLVQISNGGDQIYLVKFMDNKIFSLANRKEGSSYQFRKLIDAPNLKKLLSNTSQKKIFHYARFDVAMIEVFLGISIKNLFCTKLAYILTHSSVTSTGLKNLCMNFLDIEITKEQQCSDWSKEKLSDEQIKYAAQDVSYLHALKEKISNLMTKNDRDLDRDNMKLVEKCFEFLPVRIALDILGFSTDADIFSHSLKKDFYKRY